MEIAIWILNVIFVCLGIFQGMLIAGKPWGEYAWGGQQKILSKKFKVSSFISILIYLVVIFILLAKIGLLNFLDKSLINNSIWFLTFYFALGIPLNLISRSKKERFVMTPLVTLIFLLMLSVANSN